MRLTDRLSDPLAEPAHDRSRLRFAAMLMTIGLLHFIIPSQFERIIPRWFPWRREAVLWSGVAEVSSAALLAIPRTSRAGAAMATATIVAVYPANVQMAIDSARGKPQVEMPAWLVWARLPMQVPMALKAWSFTR
ncbi:MAG: hypothetical protein ACHQDC_00705 [Acidimicrobiales bacterium]